MEITLKGTPDDIKKAIHAISGSEERNNDVISVEKISDNIVKSLPEDKNNSDYRSENFENYLKGKNFRGEKEIAEILQDLSRRITSY
ncbi:MULTISPECIES: hypothetical protein [Leuconostoc]|uniref:hypothetical protein n=1 Tax=Leuconostoc TaxID=1243 RepID=UPI0032E05297